MQLPRLIDLLVDRAPDAESIHRDLLSWSCLSARGRASPRLVLEGIRLGLGSYEWWSATDSVVIGFNPCRAHFIMPLLQRAGYLDYGRMKIMELDCKAREAAAHVAVCAECGWERLKDEPTCRICSYRGAAAESPTG